MTSSSENEELEDFLRSVNPAFTKYVDKLVTHGLTDLDNLSIMQDEDFKYLDIPLFHWRQILAKSKTRTTTTTTTTTAGGGVGVGGETMPIPNQSKTVLDTETPEGSPYVASSSSSSSSLPPSSSTTTTAMKSNNSKINLELESKEELIGGGGIGIGIGGGGGVGVMEKKYSKAAGWGDDEVALWVQTVNNGQFRNYANNFQKSHIDGSQLLSFTGVKDLAQLVTDIADRHAIFESIEQLQNGTVPSIQEMLEKNRRIEAANKKKQTIEPSSDTITASSTTATTTTTTTNNTMSSPSLSYSKASTQNLFVKPKEASNTRQRLIKFYEIYNPAKLEDLGALDDLLQRYQGHEAELFSDLEQKYILGAPKVKKRKELNRSLDSRTDSILRELSELYQKYARHIEEAYEFPVFHTPLLDPVDFMAKPIVMLVGQYSTGKTTFIRYLVGRDFPGMLIGPEPTTDSFSAIMYGHEERLIPGHTVPMDRTKPFRSLTNFGAGFLNKFACVEIPSPLLESITFVDTPGILSGEKQRLGRNYEFAKVVEWFAYRSDRIILLFDAHKLDISDEFKASIEMLKGHDDKIRCVLNKADAVSNQALLRVYGALMWSLGKVFKTPEVLRVYVGSFWDQPYSNDHNADLFDSEAADLLNDLRALPRHCATRKINEFVKRTRQLRVHCLIIEHMRKQFGIFGKERKQQQLLENLREEFITIAKENKLNLNDFPHPDKFRELIQRFEISKFPKLKEKWKEGLDEVLNESIPALMRKLPSHSGSGDSEKSEQKVVNPFAMESGPEATLNPTQTWAVNATLKAKYDTKFYSLSLQSGKATGSEVMNIMIQSQLSRDVLRTVWDLSDLDGDGKMDHEEFALCMYLIDMVKGGNKLPPTLPLNLIPPGKRHLVEYE